MTISEILDRFRSLRVTVLGDIMLDHYVWGDTHRISPEAPVPVVEVQHESETGGGAANVALNLAALGVQTKVFGVVGRDSAGDRIRTILVRQGIQLSKDCTSPAAPTIVKTRIMVRGQQLCRLDREATPSVYGSETVRLRAGSLLEEVAASQAIIFSDYAKGVLAQELVNDVAEVARQCGALIFWDPKPSRRLTVPGLTCLTPNRQEAFEMAGFADSRETADFPATAIGERILSQHHARFLVVTLGAGGMMLYEGPDDHRRLPTTAQEVFDVSGAGDTVVAVLTAALTAGLNLDLSAQLANLAAGVVVGKLGTAVVTRDEFSQFESPLLNCLHGCASSTQA
jgi:D-beta-D-heptose 7-phosphate kinase/D-beta-D-heptose 1-phosphate adenosyltransferase